MTDAVRSDLAHLYRRAGWGATAAELDLAEKAGYAATVTALVQPAARTTRAWPRLPPRASMR